MFCVIKPVFISSFTTQSSVIRTVHIFQVRQHKNSALSLSFVLRASVELQAVFDGALWKQTKLVANGVKHVQLH